MKPQRKTYNHDDFLAIATALAADPYTLLLDSAMPDHPASQWSILCYKPDDVYHVKNSICYHNHVLLEHDNFFILLHEKLNQNNRINDTDLPFIGGAAGYFGYDIGKYLEKIPAWSIDDLHLPDAVIGFYDNILLYHHSTQECWQIGEIPSPTQTSEQKFTCPPLTWTALKTKTEYLADIQKIIDYIYAGDVYQVNLSHRFQADLPKSFNAFEHYRHMRIVNPAPFSAFMQCGDFQLSSCSPEQFLSVQNRKVTTKPIKGTLPSSQDKKLLQDSEKDKAENLMIVDLLRNDLSHICKPYSIKVEKLWDIESFAGLHHLVSTITGTLQDDKTALDALTHCFPGGSITGAPKIRAMEIIEKLEPTHRGPYCGTIGTIGYDGTMNSNIIIRTLIFKDNKAYLQVGGGIVVDSIPENEWQETLDKAAKIFESFIA